MRTSPLIVITLFLFSACGENKKEAATVPATDSLSQHYLDVAVRTANWLQATAITTPAGIEWLAHPKDTLPPGYSLYHGSTGILVFFLEMYHVTSDTLYRHLAQKAADNLLAVTADKNSLFFKQQAGSSEWAGLYTGIAGIGFALEEVYQSCKQKKYHDGMLRCIQLLKDSAKIKDNIASWSDQDDVLAGDAGTGLFLLYAYEQTKDGSLKDLAAQVGNGLIKKGIKEEEGLKWPMIPGFARLMPNFSHGTAGVSYFLVKLYEATGNKEYFQAAAKGANYVKSLAEKNNGLVFHHETDPTFKGKCTGPACRAKGSCMGKDLFYLGWCHGPAGTGRLFYVMEKETGDTIWNHLIERGNQSMRTTGIPEKLTDGFWNNLGVCCGSAGVGEYQLQLFQQSHNNDYLDFAKHLAGFIEENAVKEGDGLTFPSAENNRERNVMYTQTGFMHGAAGIGMYFLHLHELSKGIAPAVKFPDDPF